MKKLSIKIIVYFLLLVLTIGLFGINITKHNCINCGIADIHLFNINSCENHHSINVCNDCNESHSCEIAIIEREDCCSFESKLIQIVIPFEINKLKIEFLNSYLSKLQEFDILNYSNKFFKSYFFKPPKILFPDISILICEFNL